MRAQGLDEQTSLDVLVAVDEAAANAVEHPRDPRSTVFRVDGCVEGDELVVRVSDSGRWREPSELTDRGRGLPFMHRLMSEVEIVEAEDSTEIVLRRALV